MLLSTINAKRNTENVDVVQDAAKVREKISASLKLVDEDEKKDRTSRVRQVVTSVSEHISIHDREICFILVTVNSYTLHSRNILLNALMNIQSPDDCILFEKKRKLLRKCVVNYFIKKLVYRDTYEERKKKQISQHAIMILSLMYYKSK